MGKFDYRPSKEKREKDLEEEREVTKNLIEYVKSKKPEEIYLSPEHRKEYEKHNKFAINYKPSESDKRRFKHTIIQPKPYKDERDFVIRKLEMQLRISEGANRLADEVERIEERSKVDWVALESIRFRGCA